MGKGKRSKKNFKPSSGLRAIRQRQRLVKRLEMKIARWDKYREMNKSRISKKNHICDNWSGATCASRHNSWNTAGLKKHIALLEAL